MDSSSDQCQRECPPFVSLPAGADALQAAGAARILDWIEHAAHLLPSQGPIKVFVHHNTLHAFEGTSFEEGVLRGYRVYGCEPYLSESQYRDELHRGRIRIQDLEQVLLDDLHEEADRLVACFGTRYALQLAMLQYSLQHLPARELEWVMAETDARSRYRSDVDRRQVEASIDDAMKLARVATSDRFDHPHTDLIDALMKLGIDRQTLRRPESWPSAQREAFALDLLWRACLGGARAAAAHQGTAQGTPWTRHRDWLLHRTGIDIDNWVNEVLIRFCAAYLDQGFASWPMPYRSEGFLRSFVELYRLPATLQSRWMKGLSEECDRLARDDRPPDDIAITLIDECFRRLDVPEENRQEYITQSLLALPGWGGMIWQTERYAPWTPRPAAAGSLLQYVAVRLWLECKAIEFLVSDRWGIRDLRQAAWSKGKILPEEHPITPEGTAFTLFQIAQFRGWLPSQLLHLSDREWVELVSAVHAFPSLERRRILHAAYERKYRQDALDAIAIHSKQLSVHPPSTVQKKNNSPSFQVVTCIDDREESFRRHLEELAPDCETFGVAGFFAVVMYYRGAAEAHYRPLCPINVTPKHYVVEEPIFSAMEENDRRVQRRRVLGQVSQSVHAGSRTATGGVITGLFGSLATFPLVARILAPRITAQLRILAGGFIKPPATELHLERTSDQPGLTLEGLGFSRDEMAGIVVRVLQDIGLVKNFAPLVLFLGHGSSSLNNPHESAYNCGACSGGRGGPNARAFAWMANDPQVRQKVAEAGIVIPEYVRFVGGYHNTCNDQVEYYELDQLPRSHRSPFRAMEARIFQARCRNAHERCRRFESARFDLTPEAALQHVEERSEDLSQARPEYNHATNALCLVGERRWSRGLFLDRRSFLASYDPSIDTPDGKIVERILQAVIPVCGGISLEYYFSTVDVEGYGAGSKLPHNIAALAGVMTGAASDLRPGLSAQMVEIHEPLRILFVVQTTAAIMRRIIDSNPAIQSLVEGNWVQLAVFDAADSSIQVYRRGEFVPHRVETMQLPMVSRSVDWYLGHREHLGFAEVKGYP